MQDLWVRRAAFSFFNPNVRLAIFSTHTTYSNHGRIPGRGSIAWRYSHPHQSIQIIVEFLAVEKEKNRRYVGPLGTNSSFFSTLMLGSRYSHPYQPIQTIVDDVS